MKLKKKTGPKGARVDFDWQLVETRMKRMYTRAQILEVLGINDQEGSASSFDRRFKEKYGASFDTVAPRFRDKLASQIEDTILELALIEKNPKMLELLAVRFLGYSNSRSESEQSIHLNANIFHERRVEMKASVPRNEEEAKLILALCEMDLKA